MGTDNIKNTGFTWESKGTLRFQIPSQARLNGIVKPHRSFASRAPSSLPFTSNLLNANALALDAF
jgi:hypothetical protein